MDIYQTLSTLFLGGTFLIALLVYRKKIAYPDANRIGWLMAI